VNTDQRYEVLREHHRVDYTSQLEQSSTTRGRPTRIMSSSAPTSGASPPRSGYATMGASWEVEIQYRRAGGYSIRCSGLRGSRVARPGLSPACSDSSCTP
jgi:hypothetical protein